jgi:hypothetical protein
MLLSLYTDTCWMGGWVIPRASLDVVAKKKLLFLPRIEPCFSQPATTQGRD